MLLLFIQVIFTKSMYQGVFDAGSTGTRLHVYKFTKPHLMSHVSYAIQPGISELNDSNIKESLTSLVASAREDFDLDSIPFGFYATAGLRNSDASRSRHILKLVKSVLSDLRISEIRVISGEEEAMLALNTLKHLRGASSKSFGLVDMGGRSVQISYIKDKHTVNTSYNLGILEGNVSNEECVKVESCANEITKKIQEVEMQSLNDLDEIYLSSFLYKELFSLVGKKITTIKELKNMFKNKCDDLRSESCRRIFYCIALLLKLELEENKALHLLGTCNGVDFSWSLGKALALLTS